MKTIQNYLLSILFIACLIFCGSVNAKIQIAILDFELNDITSLPNIQKELERTASIKPLLEQTMKQNNEYDFIQIPLDEQKKANPGFGYLFRFHDIAANLGKQHNARWIIVGQHSKPSFLFSYFMVYIINVEMGKAIARFDIELKGNHQKVTQRAVRRLAYKINNTIRLTEKN